MSSVPLFTDVKSVLKCPNKAETVDRILFVFPPSSHQARGGSWMGRLSESACHRADISHVGGGAGKTDEPGEE